MLASLIVAGYTPDIMFVTKTLSRTRLHLPTLSASVTFCLLISAYANVDAASSLPPPKLAAVIEASSPMPVHNSAPASLHVLSNKDEALYRAIFASQAKSDWSTADTAIANLVNKKLMGHVLADRYLRTKPAVDDLKAWLAAYNDHPEASDIYDKLKAMPQMKGVRLTVQDMPDEWTGNGDGSTVGFRSGMQPTETIKTRVNSTPQEAADAQARIAASFFYADKLDEAHRFATQTGLQSPLSQWIAGLSAWKKNEPAMASTSFAKLAVEPGLSSWDKSAAAFWAYRSFKRVGDSDKAYYWLHQAANEPRSFYGMLANELIGRKPVWAWDLPAPKTDDIMGLAHYPAGARALALIQVGQTSLAEDELEHLDPRGHRDMQEAMLYLANTEGMPSLSLRLGGVVTNNGKPYDAALYPVPPWEPQKGFSVDRALIYALMRHESRFDPTAVSGAGACGLMQLMPTTAMITSGEGTNSKKPSCSDHLLDPVVNVDIGQKYVHLLANQPAIGDNLLLLLTAYNSGPAKIGRWMDNDLKHDPLLFMESMPVRETRDYVQHVMMHYWTYRSRLDEPQTSLAQLAHGEWPRFTMTDEPVTTAKHAPRKGFEVASNLKDQ